MQVLANISLTVESVAASFLPYVAHFTFPCRFQGNPGQDSQQRGPKGETGDLGPMVGRCTFLDSPCTEG